MRRKLVIEAACHVTYSMTTLAVRTQHSCNDCRMCKAGPVRVRARRLDDSPLMLPSRQHSLLSAVLRAKVVACAIRSCSYRPLMDQVWMSQQVTTCFLEGSKRCLMCTCCVASSSVLYLYFAQEEFSFARNNSHGTMSSVLMTQST